MVTIASGMPGNLLRTLIHLVGRLRRRELHPFAECDIIILSFESGRTHLGKQDPARKSVQLTRVPEFAPASAFFVFLTLTHYRLIVYGLANVLFHRLKNGRFW